MTQTMLKPTNEIEIRISLPVTIALAVTNQMIEDCDCSITDVSRVEENGSITLTITGVRTALCALAATVKAVKPQAA